MDDPQLLDLMEEVARLVRGKPDVLMGGIRVCATGDVMQLPPLGTDDQAVPQGMRRRRELATESRLFEGPGAVDGIIYAKPKKRTCKRGTVQLARTRDTPRAKQSYTENFHRTSHTAHQRRHPSLPSGYAQQGPPQLSFKRVGPYI